MDYLFVIDEVVNNQARLEIVLRWDTLWQSNIATDEKYSNFTFKKLSIRDFPLPCLSNGGQTSAEGREDSNSNTQRLLHQLRKGQLLLLILYPPKLIFKYDEQLSATWSRRWWYQKLGTWWYDEISWFLWRICKIVLVIVIVWINCSDVTRNDGQCTHMPIKRKWPNWSWWMIKHPEVVMTAGLQSKNILGSRIYLGVASGKQT